MTDVRDSPFLRVPHSAWLHENDLAFAIRDQFPVSEGHTLVITKRVVATWFDATEAEQHAALALVAEVKAELDRTLSPDGYNVGFNAGTAAGQTVPHLHVHVIPRFRGDVDDPRGGVRHVIPARANYLAVSPLATGGKADPFARHILPLIARAEQIGIVAAFVQRSGLEHIEPPLLAALARGAHVRLITGDYLEITQVEALERLLDLQSSTTPDEDEEAGRTTVPLGLEARVVESDKLPHPTRSFHPKSWWFESAAEGVAFVGSSNLSYAALRTGIEWNLRVERERQPAAYARVKAAFEDLWQRARPLDAAWIEAYAARAALRPSNLPPGELDTEEVKHPDAPHQVQLEALAALRRAREENRRRALVVMATGLGKTWLAAFDYNQLRDELGRAPRLLFVAHRREILTQAASTYRALFRERGEHPRVGWFMEAHGDLSAQLVFASVAKLSRPAHLERLKQEHFDYVVVDEVHHATAASYRKILGALDPTFLLGLTATPDRADAADIEGLFDDHVAYRAGVDRGIALDPPRLVPFRYFGVKDDIDYANIPWRNRRFDPEVLAEAAQTESRMRSLWRAWQAHPAARSVVFCCSIAHARFVKAWLTNQGLRVLAVYSAEGSDDREEALAQLGRGEVDAVCAVDVINEGVDVPAIDRVIMLRPTESGVLFLQQLGRGLRASDNKRDLTVIDFVGNHRVFLDRLRTLLSLTTKTPVEALRKLLDDSPLLELPAGCAVELELEAKDLLASLFRVGGADEIERVYRELRASQAGRPTAGELLRLGYLPSKLHARHGSWLGFVAAEGDLSTEEHAAFEAARPFLDDIESTEMTKCFKMVTLQALLDHDALATGLPLPELVRHAHAVLRRSPELFTDVADQEAFTELTADNQAEWLAYWKKNPIQAWTNERGGRRAWWRVERDRFVPRLAVEPSWTEALSTLARELVDYRLAQYRSRQSRKLTPEGFTARVTWNQRDPILKLPALGTGRPEGETEVRVQDGTVWRFKMVKEFCNVARPAGVTRNQLPDLLRQWFGPNAGQPGTAFEVRFFATPDGLWAEPVQSPVASVLELAPRRGVPAYVDLKAAAGHADASIVDPSAETVWLPVDDDRPDLFAVRVSGSSMDGGRAPLRDGDWAIMRLARGAPSSAVEGRVVLVQTPAEHVGSQYQIKRLTRAGEAWSLTSDNPTGPSFPATPDTVVIAKLERAITPESLAPPPGTVIREEDLATRFGLAELSPRTGHHAGHLFVFIEAKGALEAPDRIRMPELSRRWPSETGFALAREDAESWRYLGVARATEHAAIWSVPEVDFRTWRQWGTGRSASRELPESALARAQEVVDRLLGLPEADLVIVGCDGKQARVLGAAERGGIRIDGGEGGFEARTVSLMDIAWVGVAQEDVAALGGVLDDARVNRLRYLEGTPRESTRWIDTDWAIGVWQRFSP